MSLSIKVTYNLRILGLTPGATASEIRSAFRRLARTCHPDIAGRQGARKFEQIAGAYTFLKNLTPDELQVTSSTTTPSNLSRARKKSGWQWKNPLAWRQKQKKHQAAEEEQRRQTTLRAEEEIKRNREIRIENILARGERAVETLLKRMEREVQNYATQELTLRLLSDLPEVRHLALSRLGTAANRGDLLDTVLVLLRKWEIDEKTARLISSLPLEQENRHKLARALSDIVCRMPDTLLIYLLHLRSPQVADKELRERYLQNAGPKGIALILRYWPEGAVLSPSIFRHLLSYEDETVLVPLLGMMKQRGAPCPPWSRTRLNTLLEHPNVAVRVWAKALLSQMDQK